MNGLAKHLKLSIKNTQIAEAINLGGLKSKLAKKKETAQEAAPVEKESAELIKKAPPKKKAAPAPKEEAIPHEGEEAGADTATKEEAPRIRARSRSAFAEPSAPKPAPSPVKKVEEEEEEPTEELPVVKSSEELRRKVFGEDAIIKPEPPKSKEKPVVVEQQPQIQEEAPRKPTVAPEVPPAPPPLPAAPPKQASPFVKLGPTGRHVKDLFQAPPKRQEPTQLREAPKPAPHAHEDVSKAKVKAREPVPTVEDAKKGKPGVKDFRDVKPTRRTNESGRFDARDRQGLRDTEEDARWRKKRAKGRVQHEEIAVVRPTSLKVRVPISIKDLAVEMKLKASQLISKLFLQGLIVTLNDTLIDETTIQLLGHEFGCEITIDTSEEQRIRITDKTVKEEIQGEPEGELEYRPPVVAFMGHVDHGKTSLIDSIRKSNRAAGEAGAITQHIGAFRCHTPVGDITVLDTPGHEAFSAMRARGADVTDIVVLVVAGDEGIRQQTLEAIEHAKAAKVTIVVAINKSDKPNFNADNIYRQLSDHSLLPEVWGGQTLTVNCSAVTGAGIKELLETLALQAEILELKASKKMRARGTVLESEMHKGLGAVATVLVQNGTLRVGDALVFGQHWGRVKTMRDELGRDVIEAPPSTPVAITGMSGLPAAGHEFIVVKSEREAREIAEARMMDMKQLAMQQKRAVMTTESFLQQSTPLVKKVLNVIIRADVQGSLEALRVALQKIESQKAELAIISAGVGEISESDIQLAATSKAVVIGFHTRIESHADTLIKQYNVQVRQHDIIYHAIDDVKVLMKALLDKLAQETDKGKAIVKALFKSSQAGVIAGCQVSEGTIQRNNHIRVVRGGTVVGKSQIASLRRVKEDVREVSKGVECGIVLSKFTEIQEGDTLEAYEVTYIEQDL